MKQKRPLIIFLMSIIVRIKQDGQKRKYNKKLKEKQFKFVNRNRSYKNNIKRSCCSCSRFYKSTYYTKYINKDRTTISHFIAFS